MRAPVEAFIRTGQTLARISLLLVLAVPITQAAPRFQITTLGTLGGSDSQANALNRVGHVAGWASDTNGNQRAFLYTNGVMVNLGTPVYSTPT